MEAASARDPVVPEYLARGALAARVAWVALVIRAEVRPASGAHTVEAVSELAVLRMLRGPEAAEAVAVWDRVAVVREADLEPADLANLLALRQPRRQ